MAITSHTGLDRSHPPTMTFSIAIRVPRVEGLPSDSTSRWTPLLLVDGKLLLTPIQDLCHRRTAHVYELRKKPL